MADKLPELLPCPFCGGSADWCRHCADEGCHRIECGSCGMQFDSVCDKAHTAEDLPELREVMVRHWNARQAIAMNAQVPPTGYDTLVWINKAEMAALVDVMDRAERKGDLTMGVSDAWEEFDYLPAAPPPPTSEGEA